MLKVTKKLLLLFFAITIGQIRQVFANLIISEVYFGQSDERIEIYNNSNSIFSGEIEIKGVKRNDSILTAKVIINPYSTILIGDNLDNIIDKSYVYLDGAGLSINDDGDSQIEILQSGQIIDTIKISSQDKEQLKQNNSSIQKIIDNNLITGSMFTNNFNILSGYFGNPGKVYNSNDLIYKTTGENENISGDLQDSGENLTGTNTGDYQTGENLTGTTNTGDYSTGTIYTGENSTGDNEFLTGTNLSGDNQVDNESTETGQNISRTGIANGNIIISEIYFDGYDERIEISNIGDIDFSGEIELFGIAGSAIKIKIFIPQGQSKIISQNDETILDKKYILQNGISLSISDTAGISANLFQSGKLIDNFIVVAKYVEQLNNKKTSFEKIFENGQIKITYTTPDRNFNIESGFTANPGKIFSVNQDQLDVSTTGEDIIFEEETNDNIEETSQDNTQEIENNQDETQVDTISTVDGQNYKYKDIEITNIIFDPPGSDTNNEVIGFKSNLNKTVSLEDFYLKLDSRDSKVRLYGRIEANSTYNYKGTLYLVNRPNCVSLMYGDTLIDKKCYQPTNENEIFDNNLNQQKISTQQSFISNLKINTGNGQIEIYLGKKYPLNKLTFEIIAPDKFPLAIGKWTKIVYPKKLDKIEMEYNDGNKFIFTISKNFFYVSGTECFQVVYNEEEILAEKCIKFSHPQVLPDPVLKITKLIPNPQGIDKGNEEISIKLVNGRRPIVLVDEKYYLQNSQGKKYYFKTGFIKLEEEVNIKGNLGLRNSADCLLLKKGNKIYDKVCREKAEEGENILNPQSRQEVDRTKKYSSTNKKNYSTKSKKTQSISKEKLQEYKNLIALYKNYIDTLHGYLKEHRSILWRNELINFDKTLHQAEKKVKNGVQYIKIGDLEIKVTDFHNVYKYFYEIQILQRRERFIQKEIMNPIQEFTKNLK